MSLRFCCVLLIVKIFGDVSALEELPHVEENNILDTDAAIRHTTNKLFSILKLRITKKRLNLKQYSLIHNYLMTSSLSDYTNLIEIAKLTRVDKTKLNNETRNFMTILNEILDEDVKHEESEDEFILRHIEGFVTNLEKYTDTYQYNDKNVDIIITEILTLLEKNESFSEVYYNTTSDDDYQGSLLQSLEENNTLLDDEFWHPNLPNARRIFLGKPTKITEFPFMSSIQIFNHFQCAGSIIKSDLIITAASCLQLAWNNRFFRENPAFLSARVGSRFHNGGGENIPVLEVYFHPEYDPRTLKHNLAVLRLWRKLMLNNKKNKRVKKIDIDRSATSLASNTDGITIVGWGARQRSNIITDPYLAFDVLDYYSLEDCQETYSKQYVSKRNFCAGFISHGAGACNRDVGAPGIHRGILIGVVSFGSPVCGTPDAPTVFTKLGFYAEWIDEILEQDVPSHKMRTTTLPPYSFTLPFDRGMTSPRLVIKPIQITKRRRRTTTPITEATTPMSEDTTPISEKDVEALRVLKNKGLLKKFVDTVIGSAEAAKLLRELNVTNKLSEQEAPDRETYKYSAVTKLGPAIHEHTRSIHVKSTIGLTGDISTETQLRQDNDLEKSFESKEDEIYEYMDENKDKILNDILNIKSIDSQGDKPDNKPIHSDELSPVVDYKKDLTEKLEEDIVSIIDEIRLDDLVKKKVKNKHKNKKSKPKEVKNDDLFSLLSYISDSNKDKEHVSSFSEETKDDSTESGLDIAPDTFNDLTYRNANVTQDVFISKQELLHIVSEALKEELNKTATATSSPKTAKITIKKLNPTRHIIRTNRQPFHRKTTTDKSDTEY